MNTTMEQRVQTGVAFLNHALPDWRREIDVDLLNIANINTCILGQLFGDYGMAIENLFGDCEPAYICGFSIPYEECRECLASDDAPDPWVELQLEWLAVLK